MKIKGALLVSMLSVSLGACISAPQIREATVVNLPALNTVAHAFVGESMLQQGYGYLVTKIEITEAQDLMGTNINGVYDVAFSTPHGFNLTGIQSLNLNTATSKACFYGLLSAQTDCKNGVDVKYTQRSAVDFQQSNRMQQTLIYSGRIGNRIKLGYREFSNGYARDAFSNEAEYDISESKQVGYKKALIEVIEASNTQITYKVLRNF
tara:strand:- start:2268 stop:2891 length:624 start_codon:yes stop_codon:yes gene_type:complete